MKSVGWWIALALIAALLAVLPWIGNTVLVQFGINVLLLATLAAATVRWRATGWRASRTRRS